MANVKYNFFLLTGDPGVGKTTLTKKIVSLVKVKNVHMSGFYTQEVRIGRFREGFDVVALNGKSGTLARDKALLKTPCKYTVGKYGVLLEEFESIALPCMDEAMVSGGLLVIDELGKMEFFSEAFKNRIINIFSQNSSSIVLATVPSRSTDPIIMNIKNNRRAKLWEVTRENRDKIHEVILEDMKLALKF